MPNDPITATWTEPISNWTQWLKAQGAPATTIELRTYHLRRLARSHPATGPWQISLDDISAWFAHHHTWSGDTRRSVRSSLRVFYRWAIETGRTTEDPTRYLKAPRPKRPVPRPAPEYTIRQALRHADDRIRLMIMLGAACGMRRGEISRAHTDWIDGDHLRIIGKGGRTRRIPIPTSLAEQLDQLPRGYLFPRPGTNEPMTPAHVGKLISRALGPGVTTHMLRHRYGTRAYEVDHDIRAVQELLGHASISTTQIYTQVPDSAMRRASAGAEIHAA